MRDQNVRGGWLLMMLAPDLPKRAQSSLNE